MTRVGVLGAGGRMGREVCRAVADDPELELVAAVDPALAGIDLRQVIGEDAAGLQVAGDVEDLERSGARGGGRLHRGPGRGRPHAVVRRARRPRRGGHDRDRFRRPRRAAGALFEGSEANCVIAANFAIGAVLMMRFAELAAPFMDGVEIIELHHDGKLDAPSGTALGHGRSSVQARHGAGATRGRPTGPLAGVGRGTRGGGPGRDPHPLGAPPRLVAHQEVLFGAVGQSLTIRHDAYDRTSFMPGMILAVKAVSATARSHRRARHPPRFLTPRR